MRAGMEIDITISEIFIVALRWLIKRSAGKPSRRANKERILSSESTPEQQLKMKSGAGLPEFS